MVLVMRPTISPIINFLAALLHGTSLESRFEKIIKKEGEGRKEIDLIVHVTSSNHPRLY